MAELGTFEDLTVECSSGYRGEETPKRFFLGERAVHIEEILDRWLAPDHRYFKVKGDDKNVYILRHDPWKMRWELTMFRHGDHDKAGG
ncbi:MAG: hypothetical protein ACLFQR_04915 [Desulfovibrionales bacterium]